MFILLLCTLKRVVKVILVIKFVKNNGINFSMSFERHMLGLKMVRSLNIRFTLKLGF